MTRYNKYINNFANEAEYETYINGSVAEAPNTALIDDTGKMIYTKILPNNYLFFGTTKGTQDFMIGSSSSEYSSADCIQIHVVVEDDSGINKMYVAPEDVLKIPKYFYSSYSGFNNTEGKKILSIKKWKIDTSQVTNMCCMFDGCSKLTTLDLINFDTSKVTNISCMFYGCSKFTTLDLSNFDTSNVTNMDSTFSNCSSLISLDLSNFDTSKVETTGYMFKDCSSLTSLDLSNFDTSNVISMSSMFYDCSKLTTLDLTSFNTSKTSNIDYMFLSCSELNKLYLSSTFFNSTSLTTYEFGYLYNWTDTESLAMFVEAITAHDGTGKTVRLTGNTKNALTTEQKTAITNAGWTIS